MSERLYDPNWVRARAHWRAVKQVGDADPNGREDVINRAEKWLTEGIYRLSRDMYQDPTIDGVATGLLSGPLEKSVFFDNNVARLGGALANDPAGNNHSPLIACAGDYLYAFWGTTAAGPASMTGNVTTIRKFNTQTGVWSTLTPSGGPSHQHYSGAAVYNPRTGIIHLLGGDDDSGVLTNHHHRFDATTDTWLSDLSNASWGARQFMGSAFVDGLVWICGGYDGAGADDELWYFHDQDDAPANTWVQAADMGVTRAAPIFGFVNIIDDSSPLYPTLGNFTFRIVAAGGETGSLGSPTLRSSAEWYDPVADSWTNIASLPATRTRAGSASIQNRVMVAGGLLTSSIHTNTVIGYNPYTDNWDSYQQMLVTARQFLVAEACRGGLYILGGRDAGSTVHDDLQAMSFYYDCGPVPRDCVVAGRAIPFDFITGEALPLVNGATGWYDSAVGCRGNLFFQENVGAKVNTEWLGYPTERIALVC